MALAVTVTNHWEDTKRVMVIGTLVATGNYVTGGDTINFGDPLIKSNSAPLFVVFNRLSKYLMAMVFGTLISNGKVKFTVPDTGLEVAAGAYPAGITGDTITFFAIFKKHR